MKRNENLQRVSLKYFNVKNLKRAAREGRLFIVPSPDHDAEDEDAMRERLIDTIMSYVSVIDQYAESCHVAEIWKAVLHDETLSPLFFFTRYNRLKGDVNYYRVTAMVCLMREKGMYRKDLSAIEYHKMLEHSDCRTNRYNGMSQYPISVAGIRAFCRIWNKFR